jgi:CRISPR-associated protein Cmr1
MPKPEAITIKLKTVTPIWTGGIDKFVMDKNDRNKDNATKRLIRKSAMEYLKASSIMGGLRFWAEAYFRALGEKVCDITGKNKCIYDKQKNKNICKVCELFGCTGKSRSFILKLRAFSYDEKREERLSLYEYKYKKKYGGIKDPTWYLKPGFNNCDFILQIIPLLSQQIDPIIVFLLKTMLDWGTIGAQDQYGYGVVESVDNFLDRIKIQDNIFNKLRKTSLSSDYPAFGDFFFFIGRIKKGNNPKKIPFEIRYQVRSALKTKPRDKKEERLRHYFCGSTMKFDKSATKYNIALTPDGILRGWGWFPSKGELGKHRDDCLDLLKKQINKFVIPGTLKWKEFASKRDNVNSAKSWPEFLQELAQGKLVDLIKRK